MDRLLSLSTNEPTTIGALSSSAAIAACGVTVVASSLLSHRDGDETTPKDGQHRSSVEGEQQVQRDEAGQILSSDHEDAALVQQEDQDITNDRSSKDVVLSSARIEDPEAAAKSRELRSSSDQTHDDKMPARAGILETSMQAEKRGEDDATTGEASSFAPNTIKSCSRTGRPEELRLMDEVRSLVGEKNCSPQENIASLSTTASSPGASPVLNKDIDSTAPPITEDEKDHREKSAVDVCSSKLPASSSSAVCANKSPEVVPEDPAMVLEQCLRAEERLWAAGLHTRDRKTKETLSVADADVERFLPKGYFSYCERKFQQFRKYVKPVVRTMVDQAEWKTPPSHRSAIERAEISHGCWIKNACCLMQAPEDHALFIAEEKGCSLLHNTIAKLHTLGRPAVLFENPTPIFKLFFDVCVELRSPLDEPVDTATAEAERVQRNALYKKFLEAGVYSGDDVAGPVAGAIFQWVSNSFPPETNTKMYVATGYTSAEMLQKTGCHRVVVRYMFPNILVDFMLAKILRFDIVNVLERDVDCAALRLDLEQNVFANDHAVVTMGREIRRHVNKIVAPEQIYQPKFTAARSFETAGQWNTVIRVPMCHAAETDERLSGEVLRWRGIVDEVGNRYRWRDVDLDAKPDKLPEEVRKLSVRENEWRTKTVTQPLPRVEQRLNGVEQRRRTFKGS
ncbi:unnamed protein product [Amoebophrya sp. A120]|nr:unnamed protein product [Amoebophrya sp. A120]|eukprot:GSA120T00024177001.1